MHGTIVSQQMSMFNMHYDYYRRKVAVSVARRCCARNERVALKKSFYYHYTWTSVMYLWIVLLTTEGPERARIIQNLTIQWPLNSLKVVREPILDNLRMYLIIIIKTSIHMLESAAAYFA